MVKRIQSVGNGRKVVGRGVILHVRCGERKQDGAGVLGLDDRPHAVADIVHSPFVVPYPLEDESCLSLIAVGVADKIAPGLFFEVFDEWWRLLRRGGRLMLSSPYGCSDAFLQDPMGCRPITENTFRYLDPNDPSGLYQAYRPKPWRQVVRPAWRRNSTIEVVLEKMNG